MKSTIPPRMGGARARPCQRCEAGLLRHLSKDRFLCSGENRTRVHTTKPSLSILPRTSGTVGRPCPRPVMGWERPSSGNRSMSSPAGRNPARHFLPSMRFSHLDRAPSDQLIADQRGSPDCPESGPRGKASGCNRWVFASMATLPTPFAAYSKGPGLTELLRLYVCGLQPRPSVQLSSSRTSLTDNEYSPRKLALSAVERRESRSFVLAGFRLAPAVAGLAGMTTWLLLLVQPTELRPMRC